MGNMPKLDKKKKPKPKVSVGLPFIMFLTTFGLVVWIAIATSAN